MLHKVAHSTRFVEVVDIEVLSERESFAVLEDLEGAYWQTTVLEAVDGELLCGIPDAFRLAAFPSQSLLAVAGTTGIAVWDTEACRVLYRLGALNMEHVAVAPGGRELVASSFEHVMVWDLASRSTSHTFHISTDERSGPGWDWLEVSPICRVELGAGRVLDPEGFGRGRPWTELM